MSLSKDEQATNFLTFRHIEKVRNYLNKCCVDLMGRAELHDQSKLEPPEVATFTKYTPKLSGCTYGSDEYRSYTSAMRPALQHHYANNGHHPEHYKNGINDMNLLDLLEMLCDWKAASERHNDGNIHKSIIINGDRYGMSPQLIEIFENTAKEMF